MEDNDGNDVADMMRELSHMNGGVACATVKDGFVLTFTSTALEKLLAHANSSASKQVAVFVKRSPQA